MEQLKNKKVILWDFDGVIIDSNEVREYGFRKIFEAYSSQQVEELLQFHRKNGGWSRYVKINYFFNEIIKSPISAAQVNALAHEFSNIMRQELVKQECLIKDSVNFIKENHQKFKMHIVSGSDGNELRFLCEKLGISFLFHSIAGSPTPKIELVQEVIEKN